MASLLWAAFLAERERWSLWLAPLFGLGVALYFALPFEPPLAWGAGAAGLCLFALWILGGDGPKGMALIALLVLCLGFFAAQGRSAIVDAPMLQKATGVISLTGRVLSLEARPRGGADAARVLLDRLSFDREDGRTTGLERLRLTVNGGGGGLKPGDRVRLKAKLLPPPQPAAPGAFHFARRAYFEQVSAVGYAVSRPELLPGVQEPGVLRKLGEEVESVRQAVTERLRRALPSATGGIAAALITGKRGGIEPDLLQAYRDTGLAHLLAISGLHMTLAAGLAFIGLRAALALIPSISLRWDSKKIAAAIAIPLAAGYLALSGAGVPSQRAFLMVLAALAAVLIDRNAISMRTVAWAAFLVLAWRPESIVGASFQMSFAAVTALIATFEVLAPPLTKWRAKERPGDKLIHGLGRGVAVYLLGVLVATAVASLATAPIAAYHFQVLAVHSLTANLVAAPIMAFWIMPSALLTMLAMPFGADAPSLWLLGEGINAINQTALWMASWPYATALTGYMPLGAMLVSVLGGLWLCLWRRSWRMLGLVGPAIGLGLSIAAAPPHILVSGDGGVMGLRLDQDTLGLIPGGRTDRFAEKVWMGVLGAREAQKGAAEDKGLACDPLGCFWRQGSHAVSFARRPDGLAEDCERASVLIASVPLSQLCTGPALVVDRFDLYRKGAMAIWLREGRPPQVVTVSERAGTRPWSPDRWQ